MRKLFILLSLAVVVGAAAAQAAKPAATVAPQTLRAEFQTTDGNITCELFPDKAPITVDNFIGLATGTKEWRNPATHAKMRNKPLYDGTIFHRVIPGFMIQAGDPMGNGTGDPGYSFKDEFSDLRFDQPGRLAMANSGPNTNGSQIFITEVPTPHLNNRHTIFGQCGPMSVVSAIARTPRDPSDKPFHPVKIIHVLILKPGQSAPTSGPAPAKPAARAPAARKPAATPTKPATPPKQ
jgi:peptidyl-prolyl cis-trans isomerase A (cyclophilin A)